jgi:hypothetical protein
MNIKAMKSSRAISRVIKNGISNVSETVAVSLKIHPIRTQQTARRLGSLYLPKLIIKLTFRLSFELLTAVLMNTQVCCDIMLCRRLLHNYRSFGVFCCLYLQGTRSWCFTTMSNFTSLERNKNCVCVCSRVGLKKTF